MPKERAMTYEEVQSMKDGDRVLVNDGYGWRIGTFRGFNRGGDPAAWIAFDCKQAGALSERQHLVYTGLQFKPEYWAEIYKPGQERFRKRE